MSFNFSSLTRNQMQAMVPVVSNITNGTNFIPQIAMAAAAVSSGIPQIASGPTLLSSHLSSAGLNDNPLEFKNSVNIPSTSTSSTTSMFLPFNKNNSPVKMNNDTSSKSGGNMNDNNKMGAQPMDLENDNESQSSITENLHKKRVKDHETSGISTDDLTNDSLSTEQILGSNEMYLNAMLGVGPPSQFMMMSGIMMDPTMAATLQIQQYPLMAATAVTQPNSVTDTGSTTQKSLIPIQPTKEIITCKSFTLYPPNSNALPPTVRERPPGCRTIFVGGLPEKISEEILRDIFERCGEITTLRLSKKNFCHIRFVFEASVDSAIYLSGYRLRIANSSEPSHCGRLHVDYAQARDDQYEWECKQRQLQREQRHRERLERDRLRSMSPPLIVHYTEHEAGAVSEKLKNDETFLKAVQTLVVWLERGDCSKKNSNTFYSMIQSTNAHVRRLQNDKQQYEEDLKRAREHYRKQMLNMTQQFTQIEKVFSAASHKKVWDHFSKAQRKNIDLWKKQSMEIRCVQIEDDEMEMSDDDRDYKNSSSNKKARYDHDSLREENDSLRCQLEAYKNEINLVKSDIKSDSDVREQQIKVLQETIRNLQTQLIENKIKEKEFKTKIEELEDKLKQASVKELLLKTKVVEANAKSSTNFLLSSNTSSDSTNISVNNKSSSQNEDQSPLNLLNNARNCDNSTHLVSSILPTSITEETQTKIEPVNQLELNIVILTSSFLSIHPLGANLDCLCSYLKKFKPNISNQEIKETLSRYKNIFYEESFNGQNNTEIKWKFCGLNSLFSNETGADS